MEKILKLYTYVDGTNDTPFPSADEQVIIGSFAYTANRMGSAPQIAATVKHRLCLDDLWNDKVYAEFNGEKYFVINTPSSSKSNDDARYEHDLELLSEREILNHVYFIDAVQGDSDTDVYKSNSTKVLFYGDIQQFVARLNASLSYRNLGYTAVIDDGITSEDKQVSFEDKYILEALQEEFNIFEIPYYFVGKAIHFGYTSNAITTTFKYGHDDAFLSISKDNANYALINRITGVGSSDNIPYYYPNETDDQSAVEASGKKWITPSQNLMPSIYRESDGAEMFYEAKNNTYPDGEGGYYVFENEYSENNPREGKTNFENIKPTITGITNAAGQRIDMFSEFAYDTNDNDEVDEEGNYLHPYFFAKLRKTDGTYGFNLFDHAIESQTMQITFTSGICGACTFEIAVGEDTQKNLVQVGETSGALMRDEDGNVLCGREDLQQPQTPQDRQNDTRNYEVWIALRKDNSTYPQVMPNVNYNYKPSTSDTFAILGISLPQAYILKAEDELEKSLVKHMWMNNVEKFTFSAKFSRIFFTEHPEVLAQLNENARVIIEYNGKQHTLYIDNYTYKMDSGSPLPEIDIDLVDTLSVGQNSLQTQLDSIKQDILSSVGGADFLKQGLKYFLRKDTSDTARGKITFVRGLDVGTFAENTSGGTFRVLEDLTTYAEVDKLRVRVKAYFETLEIINTNSVGGKMILTAGGGVYLREVKDRETLEDGTEQVWDFYRCYFLTEQDGREVENRFHVGDLAMSQSFNIKAGTHQGVTNHYYWREVVGIGDDYIDLSKTICDTGSDAPMAEDTVCHLGNRSDKDRQGAIIFSAVDVFSPSITLYYGINDFSLVNKDYVSYGVDKTTGNAFFRVYGEMYAGDREQTSYVKYTPGVGVEMRGKFLNQSGESYDTIIDSIQNAIDGNIETWFGEEEPTLQNYPASEWTTDEDKNTHLGDLYYSDAGVAYRFQMEGAQYVWKMLKDSDITKALADAKAAKDAADAAQEAADAAADRLTAWASDGVISPTEKQGIKDEIARIDADKANITAQYTKYGLGTPTAFNNAYTAYRAVLVSLSASTPENIAIPSDFSSKQTYYYNERTSALGAIADASITSVNNVTEQLEQMKQDFAEVKEDVAGVKTSVDGLKNFTDEAFADGIVDRNESAAIASHINSIETFAKDAAESYTKVYDNTLLTGTAKTNLANAYTAFTTAKTELVTTINGVIADGLVDALEKSAVDGKYAAFNTKYGDFVANLNAANRAIQDAINQNALQALQKIGELDYLKAALKEFTTIEGGLIQSSTLALGYTSDSGYQVMAGTNGIYDASKLGGGIASWWGGAMFDRFEYTEETMPENVASALVRMDGTGYFAKGNLWWESDGTLHADPLSFFVGEETVGDVLGLFQFVKSDAGVEYVIPQHPFQKLEIGNYLQIGKAQLYWDEANQAFYVRHQDGVSPVGFYATGFISTKGANPNAGGAVSGASSLDELSDVALSGLQDGQVLSYDTATQKWVNKSVSAGGMDEEALEAYLTENQYAKKGDISIAGLTDLHSSWDALLKAQKPTTLAGYGIADGVNDVSVTGSGNVVTSASVSGHVLTLTKGLNAITSVSLATISDLHSSWDAVLKAQKPAWLTTVSLATISDLHASWDALLKAAPSAYMTRWPAWSEVTSKPTWIGANKPSYAFSEITGKPTTLGGYGITDGVNSVSVTGSGNAVTAASVSGHTLTLTKGSTFLLSSAYTAADVLAKLKTVDGSGSGLDADTLDGYHLSNIETGGWTRFITYIYDATNGTRYYSYRIGNLNKTGDVILRVRVCDDINYPSYSEWTLRMAYDPQYTPVVSLVPNTPCDRTLTVYVDSSKYLWIQCNATWTSYMEYKIEHQTGIVLITSNPTRVEEAPSNVAYTITNFGSTRNGVANKSYSYWAHTFNATTSIKIGSGTIYWDATNNCFHFSHGLYSDSFVSTKGANSGSGGTVSGVTELSKLSDVQLGTLATNQVLSWNGSKWVNKTLDMGLDETALAQYLTNNQYLTMPTGDARYVKKTGDMMTGDLGIRAGASTIDGSVPYAGSAVASNIDVADLSNYKTILGAITMGSNIWYNIISIRHRNGNGDGNIYGMYIRSQLTNVSSSLLWGKQASGTWGAERTILDSSNYSSIIGNSFVKKSGDTITGELIVKTDSNMGVRLVGDYDYGYLQFGNTASSSGTHKGIIGGIGATNLVSLDIRTSNVTSGITINSNKVWHAGNDGSGSGLDADLLDGYHRSNLYNSVDTWLSSVGLSKTITVTGDKNTYYPVEITVSSSKRIPTIISIHKDLGSTTPDISGNHSSGTSSLWLIYEMRKTLWDGNGGFVRTVYKSQPYATLVANAKNNTQGGGNLIVWLRGGTCSYQVTCTNTFTATPYYTTTNVSHQTGYTDNVSPTTSISNGGIFGGIQWFGNVTGNVTGNAATATTATQANQLTTASTINGTAFNGTSNIVTSYWGTARNFYIRDHDSSHTGVAVSVNGSANEYLLLPSTITASLNGNATSASYWQTARTLTVSGDATGSVSIRGNANMSLSLDVKYATSAGNADTVDGLHWTSFARSYGGLISTDPTGTDTSSTSTQDFLNRLHNTSGLFNSVFGFMRGSWYYAGNTQLNTGVGNLEMAGTAVLNMSQGTGSGINYKTLLFLDRGGTMFSFCSQESGVAAWSHYAKITDNVYSATKLQTSQKIWGRPFDGTAPVSGNMTGVGSISMAGSLINNWGAVELYGATPYIDFHYNNSSADYTSRLIANGSSNLNCTSSFTANGNITAPSFYASNWFRSTGQTGWYSETYGGGWHMTDSTWIRAYNGKGILTTSSIQGANLYATSRFYVSAYGTNYLGAGNGDNATTSTYNVKLHLHWGMAVTDNGDKVTMLFNGRSGTIFTTGGLYSNGYVSALGQNSSDARLKTNIQDFKATTLIKQLHPKSFEWNDLAKSKFEVFRNTGTQYGLIAQDVKEVMPEWVDDNLIGSGYMGIRYDKLIPVLLQGEIETISRVETLEDKVRRLEKENYKLKKLIYKVTQKIK